MLDEVLDGLAIISSGLYFDGTFGGGGHSSEILERLNHEGQLIGCDADHVAIERGRERFKNDRRVELRHGYFSEVCATLLEESVKIDGALLDLGVSSRQLDSDQVGLSYREEMKLDMRFDQNAERRIAADIVNDFSAGDLATLLRTYGEEPAAWKIAQEIERSRKGHRIETTTELRQIIEKIIPQRFLVKTLARVFQALRIEVNDELGELQRGLDRIVELLHDGGRVVVLSYHSLEDRIVKQSFRHEERNCICPPGYVICQCGKKRRLKVLTRKPLRPTPEEIERNPRARSARLRIAERIAD